MCELSVELKDYAITPETVIFECYVIPCVITSLTVLTPIPRDTYIYTIGDSILEIPFPTDYVQSPDC